MSWNAAQILKSIKNGTEHKTYSEFASWKTSEGLKVTLKIKGWSQYGWWLKIEREHETLHCDYVTMTGKEVGTIERIILRRLLA